MARNRKKNMTVLVTDFVSCAHIIHPSPFRFSCARILRNMGPLCIFQDQNVTDMRSTDFPEAARARAPIFLYFSSRHKQLPAGK